MKTSVDRQTVDLSDYPEMIVIYLGMRVRTFSGIKTLLGLGPQIDKAGQENPEGLLHYENNIVFSLFPLHIGMRWYWKDYESMERWTRSSPHSKWWKDFMANSGGTGFWHETYFMKGGMEAIYSDLNKPQGFQNFAPSVSPKGSMFSSRKRLNIEGESSPPPEGTDEETIY